MANAFDEIKIEFANVLSITFLKLFVNFVMI